MNDTEKIKLLKETLEYCLTVLNMAVANDKTYEGGSLTNALADAAYDADIALRRIMLL